MPTGNKRVTQLVELTAGEVQLNDLFLIIDSSAKESKKIQASQLATWLNSSGSIFAIHAINADTASYILASDVVGLIASASYAISSSFASQANQSLTSITSSFAITASFALNSTSTGSNTASFLVYAGFPNGTASYALNALTSNTSNATAFLVYSGGDNGTASYAITSQNVQHATTADTASFVIGGSSTASYAIFAQTAGSVNTASFLLFSGGNNGTASYAMATQKVSGIIEYGIFLADTQSISEAQLDKVDILWSTTGSARTPIEAMGTVVVPFTSSIPTDGTVFLSLIDRNLGIQTLLDSTPISVNISPTVGNWGNYNSGTIKLPFSLMGQSNLYGSYLLFVSCSNNIRIESTRTTRFNISSESDVLNVNTSEPDTFITTPSDTPLFTYTTFAITSSLVSNLSTLLATGSSQILTLDAINQGIVSMRYFWTLSNLTASNVSNNGFLSFISGVPNALTYFSCSNCALPLLYTFESSSIRVLGCNNNFLTSLPNLPQSMSYIDCSNNLITSLNLPLTLSYLNCSNNQLTTLPILPSGSTVLFADNNNLLSFSLPFSDTIFTMSMNNNVSMAPSQFSSLPANLVYFSINNCPAQTLPTMPSSSLYIFLQSCSLFSYVMDNVTSDLANYGMVSGTLDIRGNGLPSATALSNLAVLNSNAWTLFYDI